MREQHPLAISTERLELHAQIDTENQSEVERSIKHRLQARRWLGGEGRELYEVDEDELNRVVADARRFSLEVLPRLEEAERLGELRADGRVLPAGEVERALHRELLRWRQVELTAKQEQRRVQAELKILMQTASQIEGLVTWKNRSIRGLDVARPKTDAREVYEAFSTRLTVTRPFAVPW